MCLCSRARRRSSKAPDSEAASAAAHRPCQNDQHRNGAFLVYACFLKERPAHPFPAQTGAGKLAGIKFWDAVITDDDPQNAIQELAPSMPYVLRLGLSVGDAARGMRACCLRSLVET